MAVIVDSKSKIIIQGITGSVGRSFAERMVQYNTPIVGGVTPGKGGTEVVGLPVFNSVKEATTILKADTSFICVNPKFVKDAVFEAIDAGIKVIVIYAEGVYQQDSIEIVQYAKINNCLVFGPNSAGVVSPGKANISDIHDSILLEGSVGIVSRSGTLTYEVVEALKKAGLGVSTIACLGGDPIVGVNHVDVLKLFEEDPLTTAVIYVGEIGGNDEVNSAEYISQMKKPVYAYIAGLHAPMDKRMGHAGAIINNESETAKNKLELLTQSGAKPISLLTDLERVKVES
ncbi:CoA-binding protein [Ureibacillus sp. NPDC094379]